MYNLWTMRGRGVAALTGALLLSGSLALAVGAQGGARTFPETGHTVSGRFLAYWDGHGGLAQQGYPLSEEFSEVSDLNGQPYTVQYFERAVFEFHRENPPPYDVLLSQLGTFRYQARYPHGAPGQTADQTNGHYFAATGHWVGGKFWQYWQQHGGLAQQGYPLSDEFREKSDLDGKTYLVQYFERAVFEWHPENPPPYDVLLSQLGTFRLRQKYAYGPPGPPCVFFPPDNIWNRNIASLPIHPRSAAYMASIGLSDSVHPDFGAGLYEGEPIGIPYTTVPGRQPGVPLSFTYNDESDPGPYPIPTAAPIEGGPNSSGDRHVLVVNRDACTLYELFNAFPQRDGSWAADAGARWNLDSNALRPDGWTSADAAGLPILPGLVRYDEVASGAIHHALRFSAPRTQQAHIWPARHDAGSSSNPSLPPLGLRVRLKASVDISGYSAANQVILQALKDYGMFLADNGSSWYLSGAPDDRWNNDELHLLDGIQGADFEAVDESGLLIDADSGQSR
ncbi:MAG TPA: hypothetical protein VKY74_04805 [Chloroflexia bacterium]|nr:hypothetical protein [Chloroflexia bacterium]